MSLPVRGDRSCRDSRGGADRAQLPTDLSVEVMQKSTNLMGNAGKRC